MEIEGSWAMGISYVVRGSPKRMNSPNQVLFGVVESCVPRDMERGVVARVSMLWSVKSDSLDELPHFGVKMWGQLPPLGPESKRLRMDAHTPWQ